MAVDVYLNFNGDCREAIELYAKVFGAEKQQILTFGDSPADPNFPLPEEAKHLIMHTYLNIAGNTIMFSDVPPGMPFTIGNNISLILRSNDVDEMTSWFNQLKEGGNISMELQETFWSKCYGFVTDKFGVGWQFNYSES